MKFDQIIEQIEIRGRDVASKIRDMVREGNVRRIIVKDRHGDTFAEIPVTIGVVGLALLPIVALVGALSALFLNYRIVIERVRPKATHPNPSLVKK